MKTTKKNIQKLINIDTMLNDTELKNDFNNIIIDNVINYGIDDAKDALKAFFNDLQRGGCQSGMISEFIYHSDCKDFYIKNIDELEDYKQELADQLGEEITNRLSLPHYTFLCWLCFEEYCYELYNSIFE